MKFWVVWQPESGTPTKRHSTKAAAQLEAHRLCKENPGKAFYVLEATDAYVVRDVEHSELQGPAPIMFKRFDPFNQAQSSSRPYPLWTPNFR